MNHLHIALLFIFVCLIFSSCLSSTSECTGKNLNPDDKLRVGVKHRPDICDRKSKKGDMLSMHYDGRLYSDCTPFDSSRSRDSPFTFVLGNNQVISGWDRGLLGMCIGEKRKLTIPSGMAYGKQGAPPSIPPDATLVFDVELISFS